MKNTAIFAALCGAAFGMSGTAFAAPSVLGVTTGAGYIPMVKAVNEVCKAPDVKKALEAKWLTVGNVPQAISYVVRGEADVAFVNVVAAKKNHEKLGGMMAVKTGYEPITMTASIVKGAPNEKAAEQYLSCLTTPKAKAVLQKFGVGDAK